MRTRNQLQDFDHYKTVLKGHYGKATYDNWFRQLNLLKNDGAHLILSAPSRFSASQIDQRFGSIMKDLWRSNVGPIDRLSIKQNTPDLAGLKTGELPKPTGKAKGHKAKHELDVATLAGPAQMPKASAQSKTVMPDDLEGLKSRSLDQGFVRSDTGTLRRSTFQHRTSRHDVDLAAPLDDRMTFDRFCGGAPNRLALKAARNMMRASQQRLILIHGASGYGKTHLLNAVGHEWLATYESANVLYLTYDNLLNGYVSAVMSKSINELRAYLNEIDILLVDDVHLLRGRKATQEELACLINRLVAAGKKVVVAASMPAIRLAETGLSDRLRDRLLGGLAVELSAPDYEMRLKILEQAEEEAISNGGTPLERSYLELIARRCDTSVRELEGIFSMVRLHRDAADGAAHIFDTASLKALLHNQLRHNAIEITQDDILDAVVEQFGVTAAEIRSLRRQQPIARARHAFCFICRQMTDAPLKTIGASIHRDHTTVISSIARAEALAQTDAGFGERISALLEAFES